MKKKVEALPALYDEEFKQKQMERVVSGIESVGNYFEETKKQQKWNLVVTVAYFILLFLIIGGTLGYAVMKGGFFGLVDKNAPIRKIDCSNGIFNDTLRTYKDAVDFVELFGGSCSLRLEKG